MVDDRTDSHAGGGNDRGDDAVDDTADDNGPWGTVDDEVRPGAERDEPATDDGEPEERQSDGPAGPEPNSARVLPGDPNLENAFFVVVGMIAMALVLVRLGSLGV